MNIESLKQVFKRIFNEQVFSHKETNISLIAKYSLGNVNLQRGRFSTELDVDKRRKEICHYSFIENN